MIKLGTSFKIRCQQVAGIPAQLPEDAYHGEYLLELAQECIKTYGPEVLNQPDEFFSSYAKEHLLARLTETLRTYNITYDVWFSEKLCMIVAPLTRSLSSLQTKDCSTKTGMHSGLNRPLLVMTKIVLLKNRRAN